MFKQEKVSRRSFLGLVGTSALIMAYGSNSRSHEGDRIELTEGLLRVESGPGQIVKAEFAHHHHYLEIPLEYILNPPPQGLKIHTGWAIFENKFASIGEHYHTVLISRDNLVAVGRGETVELEDTVKDHRYILRLDSDSRRRG